MTREDAAQQVNSALDELAAALDRGQSQQLITYLATMARFHRYSLRNVVLIARQCPDATRIAGFQAWKAMGRFVRRGQRAIVILAPIVYRREARPEDAQRSEPREDGAEAQELRGFKAVHVFDISQTEGEPLPDVVRVAGDPGDYTERLSKFIDARGITLRYEPLPRGTDGVFRSGTITVRPGLPAAEEFAVLVHELAHAMLHRGQRAALSDSVCETEAEAVAFVVSRAIGLDMSTQSSDYIQLHAGDRATLTASLAAIQTTAAQILSAIQPGA